MPYPIINSLILNSHGFLDEIHDYIYRIPLPRFKPNITISTPSSSQSAYTDSDGNLTIGGQKIDDEWFKNVIIGRIKECLDFLCKDLNNEGFDYETPSSTVIAKIADSLYEQITKSLSI